MFLKFLCIGTKMSKNVNIEPFIAFVAVDSKNNSVCSWTLSADRNEAEYEAEELTDMHKRKFFVVKVVVSEAGSFF